MEICTDIHKALAAVTRPYEQVCFVIDDGLMNDGLMNDGLMNDGVMNDGVMNDGLMRLGVSEAEKGIETVEKIWDFLFSQGMTRRGLLVAIGGGVLTDIAGFAAATYMRGIDYVNVPTTLLSMVDASSGGKTGINYHGLKNSIGAFHAPKATLIYPEWLRTLPASQFLSGFGEMLKMGLVTSPRPSSRGEEGIGDRSLVIGDSGLWDALLRYDLETMPIEELTPLIAECVAAKERIVAADPQEKGLRKVLNFGHTFGHALEEVESQKSKVESQKSKVESQKSKVESQKSKVESQKSKVESHQMPHGYAVVYGMIAELYLSVVKLGCPREPLQQLTQLMLHYYGRPNCSCKDREELIRLMQHDKKNEHAAEINCTLLQSIGHPVINQVITPAEADEALEYLFSL